MPAADQPKRHRSLGRLQAAPPALLAHAEPFDGFNIVLEWQRPAGVVAMKALRDALLWSRLKRDSDLLDEGGGQRFNSAALERRIWELGHPGFPSDLRLLLTVLSGVLTPSPTITAEELAEVCRKISHWAEENSLPQTAISFAQGAALIAPTHPGHAYQVGLLCRRAAEYTRSETWYRRALHLARRAGDGRTMGLAWLGLANLLMQRSDFEGAKFLLMRAFRQARRRGLFDVRSLALHDLFAVAVEHGNAEDAEKLAWQAYQAYPSSADRVPALAADVASHWLHQGFYKRALIVFSAVLPTLQLQSERLLILSMISRAAAGLKDLILFTDAWSRAWRIIDRVPTTDRACSALYNLAYASACLEDWERAIMAGRQAIKVAKERGERERETLASRLVGDVERRDFKHLLTRRPNEPELLDTAETLAKRFVRRLAKHGGGHSGSASHRNG